MNKLLNKNKIFQGIVCLSYLNYNINISMCKEKEKEKERVKEREMNKLYDIAVIGGGVVGLSVARSCKIQTDLSVILIEKENMINAGVSARNSGLGCTGYDAPVGSLERRLLRRSIRRHQNLYRSFGLTYNHVRKCGSLVVAWNEQELSMLPKILQENREGGDIDAILLTQKELLEFEPNLSPNALGAVYCPYESVVEPWLVPMGYAESCHLNGVEFKLGKNFNNKNGNIIFMI